MFKKFFSITFVSFALAAMTFAAGESFALNIGLSFPQVFNLKADGQVAVQGHGNQDVKSERYSSIGINFGARGIFPNKKFGLFVDGDVYWPLKYIKTTENATLEYNLKDSGSKLWGIDGTIGIYVPLISTGVFSLPLGAGLHMNYINHEVSIMNSTDSASNFSLGIGAFVNAEISIGSFTLYGGVRLAFDFYKRSKADNTVYKTDNVTVTVKSNSSSSGTAMLYITPALGAMFKF